ncbi:hypothetical protein FPV67DRAFT_512476, partial [Lyophyllum atratum]
SPRHAKQRVRTLPIRSLAPFDLSAACDLQACLSKNTYSPEKCQSHLRGLYECCQRMYDEAAEQGKDVQPDSTACPMPEVVKRWLKDHPAEGKPQ